MFHNIKRDYDKTLKEQRLEAERYQQIYAFDKYTESIDRLSESFGLSPETTQNLKLRSSKMVVSSDPIKTLTANKMFKRLGYPVSASPRAPAMLFKRYAASPCVRGLLLAFVREKRMAFSDSLDAVSQMLSGVTDFVSIKRPYAPDKRQKQKMAPLWVFVPFVA